MTRPKLTVEGVMDLVFIFLQCSNDENENELRQTISAIIEERDQAVKDFGNALETLKHLDQSPIGQLIKERDTIRRNYRELIADFMPDIECLPACDSYGHADECPVVNAQASVRKLREEHAALKERVRELEDRHQRNTNSQITLMARVTELEGVLTSMTDAIRIWSTEGPHHGPSLWEAEEMVRNGDRLLASARGKS